MSSKIGFIGLGNMGNPMSLNLVKKGFDLTVFDLNIDRMQELTRSGAAAAISPRDLASRVDVVITMLPGPPEIRQAVFGAEGILGGLHPGACLIDMSTSSPVLSRQIAERLTAHQCEMLDAPVTKGIPAAKNGTLTVMVGGPERILNDCRSILEAMATEIIRVGNHGMGHAMKLVNQLISHSELVAICEAFALGTQAGLDPQTIFDVVTRASGNSFIFQYKAPRILKRDFEPGFALDILYKDLELTTELGRDLRVPLFLANTAAQVCQVGRAMGLAKKDGTALVSIFEHYLGRQIRGDRGGVLK